MTKFFMSVRRYMPWLQLALILAAIIAAAVIGGAPDITSP